LKRPLAITLISWVFILAGGVGIVYHFDEVNLTDPFANDAVWLMLLRTLAILGGILTLRGSNVGRWLLVFWIAYHVGISFFHPLSEFVIHLIFFVLTVVVLFLPKWAVFFRRESRL
jgi:ABC-type branched-subunit amino acid transport system permease subunit